MFNLTGGNLQNALTQLSGEANVDGQAVTFQQMTQFLSLMLDPFVFGRNGIGGGAGALGFAPEQEANFPSDIALAYNAILKAPPPKPATLDQRWTAWGTAYGGSDKTNGDPTVGSNTFTASTFGFAAGMDYHPAPDTILGFALAGGGTNWTLAQALGSGRSDAFQAGVYGTKYFGPAYVAGSLAVANNFMTTNRTALGDQLTSSFNAQSVGGRVEAGYRYAVQPAIGVTPYGALQAQSFHTPSRSEIDLTGGGFGLNFAAMNGHRHAQRIGRALRWPDNAQRPAADFTRPSGLGARLGQQSGAHGGVPGAAGRKLRGQRRGAAGKFGAGLGRRRAETQSPCVAARQIRRRIRQRLADLRRHRDAALYVVTARDQRCARRSEPYFLMNAIMVATAFTEFGSNGCSLTKVWRAPS